VNSSKNTQRTALCAAVGAIAALLIHTDPASSQYACTTTSTDITCTNTGNAGTETNTAAGANQNATTTNSGTSADIVTETTGGGNAAATNSGTVSGVIEAVALNGGNATATNSGTVSGVIEAVSVGGGNATATNAGTVNIGVAALAQNGGNATATNFGTISGGSGFLIAETVGNGNATVTNFGTMTGAGSEIVAVAINSGGNATVNNFGTISGAGSVIVAEAVNGGNATMINSGTVSGSTVLTGTLGGGTAAVINSGTISNFGGVAIQFIFSGPDTLTLLPGSFIVGGINLLGVNDTVNVNAGNQNLTFNNLAGANVTGTVPFVVSGNRIASIDPTPFGLADKNLMDFTRAVSSILGSLGDSTSVSSGPSPTAFAAETGANRIGDAFASIPALAYAGNDNMAFKNPTMVYGDGRSVWARGFAGERFQQADDANQKAKNLFEGGAIGADLLVRSDLRFGIFAGGGHSQLSVALNLGNVTTDTVFGGVYGRYLFSSFGKASFLDFALHGGGSSNSSSRNINNNLIASGLETATASYNSSYVSPELTYGVKLPLWANYTLTPSVRLRYVAGTFGGYTETGSTSNLTVASRTIQDFEQRGELKLTHTTAFTPRDALLTSVHAGVLGIERLGDTTVNTVLLGQGLPFVTPGRSSVAGLFGGLGVEWRTRSGVSFFGAAEYTAMTDQANLIVGRGGIRVAF
jgi:hypothetical protein